MAEIAMCPRHISPRLKVGQVWYRVAYWDYWYRILEIDKWGNVSCQVYRHDGSTYHTKVWGYAFSQGWLVFNKVKFKARR